MGFLKGFFAKLVGLLKSDKAKAAFDDVMALVPKAVPIVEKIAAATPNRTVQEIAAAFETFGVPFAEHYSSAPESERGYALLALATQVLAAEAPGAATNILNSAVQLAVTAAKAAQ